MKVNVMVIIIVLFLYDKAANGMFYFKRFIFYFY